MDEEGASGGAAGHFSTSCLPCDTGDSWMGNGPTGQAHSQHREEDNRQVLEERTAGTEEGKPRLPEATARPPGLASSAEAHQSHQEGESSSRWSESSWMQSCRGIPAGNEADLREAGTDSGPAMRATPPNPVASAQPRRKSLHQGSTLWKLSQKSELIHLASAKRGADNSKAAALLQFHV